jgi:tetratricopeptide (TPR) repeat protein
MVSAVVNQTPGLAIAIDMAEIRSLLTDARTVASEPLRAARPSERADVQALAHGTVWVRPQSTGGRAAGVLIDRDRRLVLTSAAAVGTESVVDVVAPRWESGRLVPEADAYADRLGLRLSGHCVAGMVLARDEARDLALIELDAVPPDLMPLRLARVGPRMGDPVASMGHPTGIDLLWLYGAGTVRSVGTVELGRDAGERPARVRTSLLQLPHQGSASGGPVVNGDGDLIGILGAREAARQDLAYAAVPDEIRALLDAAAPLSRPRSAAEWVRCGRLALRLRRDAAAREAFRTAAELSPDDPAILAGHATSLAACGLTADARRVAESAAGKRCNAGTLAELADVMLRLGQSSRASELSDQAIKADARCAAALVVRARLRAGQGARDDLAEALFIEPGFAPAYRVRAGLRDATTDGRREAIADWSRVMELDPMDLDGLRERARLYVAVKEPKKAVADWARLTELDALRADNWVGLARARFAAGDRPGAADALRSALRVDPAHAEVVFGVVGELATELEQDDPVDHERVAAWRSAALSQLAAWIPE